MNILIAGGTGFIGQHLINELLKQEETITVVGRSVKKIKKMFGAEVHAVAWENLDSLNPDDFTHLINLSGRNIGEGRWHEKYKKDILHSRIGTTRRLVHWCIKANKKPHLYNASAIGVYGLQVPSTMLPPRLTEATPIIPGKYSDFLNEVGQKWEQTTLPAIENGLPVTLMRFGVVLKRNQAVLKKLQLSYFFGLGGKVGTGRQPVTWIHVDDLVNAILFLLANPDMTGPVNICAPECVAQETFAKTLAAAMHRPCLLNTPAWLIKFMFGQMGDELLLSGQNVYPKRLLEREFKFNYPTLKEALAHDFKA